MGTILYTRDGEGLYDHEGYVAHILDDGTSAGGTWTCDIEQRTIAWGAECVCGWAGPHHDSGGRNTPGDLRYEEIPVDWESSHARPLLRAAERVHRLDALARALRDAQTRLRQGVGEARRRGASWPEIAAGIHTSEAGAQCRYSTADAGPAAEQWSTDPDRAVDDGLFPT